MKIRSVSELQDLLDKDLVWRVREISDIKYSVAKADVSRRKFLLRAAVALSYAHWEGFIKNSTHWYLVHINSQRLKYSQVRAEFAVFGLKSELHTLVNSRKHKQNTEILTKILSIGNQRVYMSLSNAVDTESNLNSVVFENIAISVAIDTSEYQTKYNFIDESLLKKRNSVAHGEDPGIDQQALEDTLQIVEEMIRKYKGDILDAAENKRYLI